IQERNGGRTIAVNAGEGLGPGPRQFDLVVPGLQGASQIFDHRGISGPEQDDGAGADGNGVGGHEALRRGGFSLERISGWDREALEVRGNMERNGSKCAEGGMALLVEGSRTDSAERSKSGRKFCPQ